MIQDLNAGDICLEENTILNNSLKINEQIIVKKDSTISVFKEKVKNYENEIDVYQNLDTENQKTIQNLNAQLIVSKKKNKILTVFSAIFLGTVAGFALNR